LTEDHLIATYPRLWHMAHDGAWPAIHRDGLMSSAALLEAYGVLGERNKELTLVRRRESVPIDREGLLGAVLRDQKPMSDRALRKCLQDGLAPADWYALLNSRTFFWLSRSRIWSLLRAVAYRNLPQTVLTVDTAGLVAAHRGRIWLSPLNSGATLYNPQPRGLSTFRRIEDFPFAERAKTRRPEQNVVELLVEHSVPDVRDHVLSVHRVRNDEILETIWRSPRAAMDDHP
jgi:hypothetical protein